MLTKAKMYLREKKTMLTQIVLGARVFGGLLVSDLKLPIWSWVSVFVYTDGERKRERAEAAQLKKEQRGREMEGGALTYLNLLVLRKL